MKDKKSGPENGQQLTALSAQANGEPPPPNARHREWRDLDASERERHLKVKESAALHLLRHWPQRLGWVRECDREHYAFMAADALAKQGFCGCLGFACLAADGRLTGECRAAAVKQLFTAVCRDARLAAAQKRIPEAALVSIDGPVAVDEDGRQVTRADVLASDAPGTCERVDAIAIADFGALVEKLRLEGVDVRRWSPLRQAVFAADFADVTAERATIRNGTDLAKSLRCTSQAVNAARRRYRDLPAWVGAALLQKFLHDPVSSDDGLGQ